MSQVHSEFRQPSSGGRLRQILTCDGNCDPCQPNWCSCFPLSRSAASAGTAARWSAVSLFACFWCPVFVRRAFGASSTPGSSSAALYEPLLDTEREAVADLLHYLENRDNVDFFHGEPLRALSALTYSDNIDLQRSAALAFVEITAKDVQAVNRDTVDCGIFLLQSPDLEVQRAAAAAIGNLAVNAHNQQLIVTCGALEPLVRLMDSPNPEVQCNAVGCITNLATHDDNKARIARSGALIPLTRLAKSRDLRVQRNATGALLNMTHTIDNRQQLVTAGAVPVLVSLLNSPDYDVQYYCTTSLSNIAVDALHRKRLAASEPTVVPSLIRLCDSPSLKVQCQAGLALRNLASDEKFQIEIVSAGGLGPLLNLLQSKVPQTVIAAVACARNVSIYSGNEKAMVDAGFLGPLMDLLVWDNEEVQCHAMSTVRNLVSGGAAAAAAAASSSDGGYDAGPQAAAHEEDAIRMHDVRVQVVDRIGGLLRVPELPISVQAEMTACLAVLALIDDIKPSILKYLRPLLRRTNAPSMDIKANSAAAIGNLASTMDETSVEIFEREWPEIRAYLYAFLTDGDPTLQHISVWTLIQFVTAVSALQNRIMDDSDLILAVRQVAALGQADGTQSDEQASIASGASGASWRGADLAMTLLQELAALDARHE
ncbi:vacuolar protein 8 [Zopfochytrium polystomum]|nr:vacuolar protein 8 [Zopfochytrium polystomum]